MESVAVIILSTDQIQDGQKMDVQPYPNSPWSGNDPTIHTCS